MMKKITLTIFILTAAFFAPAAAQTDASAEKQAAINELVALINGDHQAEQLVNVMTDQMQTTHDATIKAVLDERTDLTAADRRAVEEMLSADMNVSVKRYTDKLMQKLDYNGLINEVAYTVYDKYYTLEEVRQITAFYKTAVGQKTLKTMPSVMSDTMQLMQARMLPKIPEILREIQQEDRREIEQKVNARKPKPKRKTAE